MFSCVDFYPFFFISPSFTLIVHVTVKPLEDTKPVMTHLPEASGAGPWPALTAWGTCHSAPAGLPGGSVSLTPQDPDSAGSCGTSRRGPRLELTPAHPVATMMHSGRFWRSASPGSPCTCSPDPAWSWCPPHHPPEAPSPWRPTLACPSCLPKSSERKEQLLLQGGGRPLWVGRTRGRTESACGGLVERGGCRSVLLSASGHSVDDLGGRRLASHTTPSLGFQPEGCLGGRPPASKCLPCSAPDRGPLVNSSARACLACNPLGRDTAPLLSGVQEKRQLAV